MIGEALAQVPNAQKTVDSTTEFYLNQGVLGATVIFLVLLLAIAGWVIRSLYKDQQKLHAERAEEIKQIIKVVEGFQDTIEGMEASQIAFKAVLEARSQALTELSHQLQQSASDTRHGFTQVMQVIGTLVDRFRGGNNDGGSR